MSLGSTTNTAVAASLPSSSSFSKPTIMMVVAEFRPWVKTGGLGDMARAVADSLKSHGFYVRVLLPGYRSVLASFGNLGHACGSVTALGHQVDLFIERREGLEVVVLRCDPLFDRPGDPYRDDQGQEWPDMAERFAVLCRLAASIVNGETNIDPPDLLHLHDWHSALTPAYLDRRIRTPVVLTIHNFMFQGRISAQRAANLELGAATLKAGRLFDGLSFLQVGLRLSDVLVTVSRSYACEIRSANRFNWWYLNDIRDRARLLAIPNWPDLDAWRPGQDALIPAKFDGHRLHRRYLNRIALERSLGWQERGTAIFCTVSRITKPKGFGFLVRQMPRLLERDCRVVIIGDGDRRLLNAVRNIARAYPRRVALVTPYSEAAARLALAGADALLMPSLTEPCGLTQQQAQVYGCVPIVARAGGLPDTVREGKTGFLFEPSDPTSFLAAVDRAMAAMNGLGWQELQTTCMRLHSAGAEHEGYVGLFAELCQVSTLESLRLSSQVSVPVTVCLSP